MYTLLTHATHIEQTYQHTNHKTKHRPMCIIDIINIFTAKENEETQRKEIVSGISTIYGRHLKVDEQRKASNQNGIRVCHKIVKRESATLVLGVHICMMFVFFFFVFVVNISFQIKDNSLRLLFSLFVFLNVCLLCLNVCKWFHHYGKMSVIITISGLS